MSKTNTPIAYRKKSLPCVISYEPHIFVSEKDPNVKIDLGAFEGLYGTFDGETSDEVAEDLDSVLYALVHCGTNYDYEEGETDTIHSAHWKLSFIRDCFRAMKF